MEMVPVRDVRKMSTSDLVGERVEEMLWIGSRDGRDKIPMVSNPAAPEPDESVDFQMVAVRESSSTVMNTDVSPSRSEINSAGRARMSGRAWMFDAPVPN